MSIKARSALLMAANQFRRYEESHLAKRTEDGDEKARVNRAMAEAMEFALKAEAPSIEEYVIGLLDEEAGEICQEIGKGLRFGMDAPPPKGSKYQGTTPRQRLGKELGDMLAAIQFACSEGFFSYAELEEHAEAKLKLHRNPDFRAMKWIPDSMVVRKEQILGKDSPVVTEVKREPNDMVTAIWSDGERTSMSLRNYPGEDEDTIRGRLEQLRVTGG